MCFFSARGKVAVKINNGVSRRAGSPAGRAAQAARVCTSDAVATATDCCTPNMVTMVLADGAITCMHSAHSHCSQAVMTIVCLCGLLCCLA